MGMVWRGLPKVLLGIVCVAFTACFGAGSHVAFDHAPNPSGGGDLPGSLTTTTSSTDNSMGVQQFMTSPSYSVFSAPTGSVAPTIQSSTHYQVSPAMIEGASDALR